MSYMYLQEGSGFDGGKGTRVQWVGNADQILATGVSKVGVVTCVTSTLDYSYINFFEPHGC